MKIQYVARDMNPANSLEYRHIVRVMVQNVDYPHDRHDYPIEEAVKSIEQLGVQAVVIDGGHETQVKVVTPKDGPKYVRTEANGTETDNLLKLPTFQEYGRL